jgi:hypothetical protein
MDSQKRENRRFRDSTISDSSLPPPIEVPETGKTLGVSDQPIRLAGRLDLCALQKPLPSRVVLQTDQAASSHQTFLWHLGRRREGANPNRGSSTFWSPSPRPEASLHILLQMYSVILFKKIPMPEALSETTTTFEDNEVKSQLNLFSL